MSLHYVTQQRPITAALRRSVVEDLPGLEQIGDGDLRRKAIEAWPEPHRQLRSLL